MTPAARVQTAIEILDDVLAGKPAEKALTGWARRSRYAGSKDRAAVRDHVYDALRRRNSAAALGGGLSGRAVMIGLLRQEGVDLDTLFTGPPYAPEPLKVSETEFAVETVPLDVPDWLVEPLRASLGAVFDESMRYLKQRAPVGLRVNLQKTTRSAAQAALQENGIETRAASKAESGLLVTLGARKIAQSPAYRDGLVELQDVSSQSAVEAIPLCDGMSVLDYCAGGGGKLLAMAGRARGRFYAHDALAHRMRDLPSRADRAGVKVVLIEEPAQHAPYDLVFCDVPCSGTGTWRRTPDSKWRFTQPDLDKLLELQQQILSDASELVKPKGTLVYATCSILLDENSVQIAQFLKNHPEWRLAKDCQLPICTDSDGFYFATLTRD
ncbi:RsmB/NOP family class I SAM-dependent RNA methyltransferase [Shimia sp.]|uniref:RsmB/NOP family class I SAM-dependent RNA methyltransferase n=1 Tax=Shimia sp. TaxID=1954381 RepID=UPI003297D49A